MDSRPSAHSPKQKSPGEGAADFSPSGLQFYPVRGYSMRPLIREGDVVKVRMSRDEFKRADVILYRSNGGMYCHRVVRKVKEPAPGYLIHCDPFPGQLAFVEGADVIGKAIAVGRGTEFASLERGRYRLFGEVLIFIGLYMRWLPDLLRAIKRTVRGGQ